MNSTSALDSMVQRPFPGEFPLPLPLPVAKSVRETLSAINQMNFLIAKAQKGLNKTRIEKLKLELEANN